MTFREPEAAPSVFCSIQTFGTLDKWHYETLHVP
jgi:hypothetical protein